MAKVNRSYIIGPKNPTYRTGKTISDGYVVLSSKEWGENLGRVEHRVMMEKHLGRKLLPTELVHHLNGNKTDNRLSNLAVVERRDHPRIHGTGSILICTVCGRERWYSPSVLKRLKFLYNYLCRDCLDKVGMTKICKRCGHLFRGISNARFCEKCTQKNKKSRTF